MAKCILVLEDNSERREAMRARLAERLSMYELILTDDPAEFIKLLHDRLPDVLVASLDHDLHERPDQSTTVTGMDVVDDLVEISAAFPILLHTSNRHDGMTMKSRLLRAGWQVTWVTPFDDVEWVGADWYPALKRAIRSAAQREPLPEADDRD